MPCFFVDDSTPLPQKECLQPGLWTIALLQPQTEHLFFVDNVAVSPQIERLKPNFIGRDIIATMSLYVDNRHITVIFYYSVH